MQGARDMMRQTIVQIDEILRDNPVLAGEKSRAVKLVDDDAISIIVSCMLEGAELKHHYHKKHAETEYFVRGAGELLVGDRWVEVKAGSLHFNPANAVHAIRNTGTEPLVALVLFTPGMKDTDRHFTE